MSLRPPASACSTRRKTEYDDKLRVQLSQVARAMPVQADAAMPVALAVPISKAIPITQATPVSPLAAGSKTSPGAAPHDIAQEPAAQPVDVDFGWTKPAPAAKPAGADELFLSELGKTTLPVFNMHTGRQRVDRDASLSRWMGYLVLGMFVLMGFLLVLWIGRKFMVDPAGFGGSTNPVTPVAPQEAEAPPPPAPLPAPGL